MNNETAFYNTVVLPYQSHQSPISPLLKLHVRSHT